MKVKEAGKSLEIPQDYKEAVSLSGDVTSLIASRESQDKVPDVFTRQSVNVSLTPRMIHSPNKAVENGVRKHLANGS